MNYEDYFSEKNILNSLIKHRVKEAKKRHDALFYERISNAYYQPVFQEELYSLFPPRKEWLRPDYKTRKNFNSQKINSVAISRAIRQVKSKKSEPEWLIRLDKIIIEIREAGLKPKKNDIQPPEIVPKAKDKNPSVKITEYRPISQYDLKSRIIIGQTAKYIRDTIDSEFLSESFAFRDRDEFGKTPNHHDAVRSLIEYSKKQGNRRLYVAECDIRKFFDIVNHDVVLEKLKKIQSDLALKGILLDQRAILNLKNYLGSYTFLGVARPETRKSLSNSEDRWRLPWPRRQLNNIYENPSDELLGVPQGGALSPIIANIMLHSADKAIAESGIDGYYYARYCDDMIIIHPQKKQCKRLLQIYLEELKNLKLIIHRARKVKGYNEGFYKLKSKLPYLWDYSRNSYYENPPWISFLGYQVRRDGKIRIREKSIDKELKKQKAVVSKVLRVYRDVEKRKLYAENVEHRTRLRLISMSVGDVKVNKGRSTQSFCWVSGFKLLNEYPFSKKQLRQLDKARQKQLGRLKYHLYKNKSNYRPGKRNKKIKVLRFYGGPFSYIGQFNS